MTASLGRRWRLKSTAPFEKHHRRVVHERRRRQLAGHHVENRRLGSFSNEGVFGHRRALFKVWFEIGSQRAPKMRYLKLFSLLGVCSICLVAIPHAHAQSNRANNNQAYGRTKHNNPTYDEIVPTEIRLTTIRPTIIRATAIRLTTIRPTIIKPTAIRLTTIRPTIIRPTAIQLTTIRATVLRPMLSRLPFAPMATMDTTLTNARLTATTVLATSQAASLSAPGRGFTDLAAEALSAARATALASAPSWGGAAPASSDAYRSAADSLAAVRSDEHRSAAHSPAAVRSDVHRLAADSVVAITSEAEVADAAEATPTVEAPAEVAALTVADADKFCRSEKREWPAVSCCRPFRFCGGSIS